VLRRFEEERYAREFTEDEEKDETPYNFNPIHEVTGDDR